MLGIADSSKIGEELSATEGVWLGEYECCIKGNTVGTMLGYIEGCDEYTSANGRDRKSVHSH